ncbi:MAG TPA: hypothetical protein VK638_24640 [Edaphobacter sp.]|nr:hypothetical protein [Edaphobacter sp.]
MSTNPPETGKKYDVAISFLVQDSALAQVLADKLSEGLEVFFFPHNQEELAGTDGLESMRVAFKSDTLLNVVLYRERWGNTPWTAVEAAAVKDSCLATGFRSLFFFVVQPTTKLPDWLPDTHVRFNYSDFTLEQAVGAIKMRVQERGGHFTPMTAAKRAGILKAEDSYRWAKSEMNSSQGLDKISLQVKEMFIEIERQCEEVNAASHLQLEFETQYVPGNAHQVCILRNDRVGMIVIWRQTNSNTLEGSGLFVQEFNGRMLFNSEIGRLMQLKRPDQVAEHKYEPELSRCREYGWKVKGSSTEFITSVAFAEKCVIQFVDLIERYNSGKVKKMEW